MPVKSKSFTGCWTCRARKIKCDLGTPECRQCEKAGIKCEGYSIKLRWSGEADPGNDRRAVEFVKFPENMMYTTYDDLDGDLNNLNVTSPQGDATTVVGPFGVFHGCAPRKDLTGSNSGRRRRKNHAQKSNSEPQSRDNSQNSTPALHPHPSSSFNSTPQLTPQGHSNSTASTFGLGAPAVSKPILPHSSLLRHEVAYPNFNPDPSFIIPGLDDDCILDNDPQAWVGMESELMDILPSNFSDQMSTSNVNLDNLQRFLFGSEGPPVDMPLPQDEAYLKIGSSGPFLAHARYLLWHYKHHLAPVMTYVRHPKNPWASIYLPRAYAAVGDITIQGYTTPARFTLLHAFLAISAYHVRNKMADGTPGRIYWDDMAEKLRAVTVTSLQQSLQGDPGKYKDLLVALLSMVTMDLVKGESGIGVVPLNAAQKLINFRCSKRPKLSRKAMILHRICCVLTLLQRSTTFTEEEINLPDEWMDRTFDDVVVPQNDSRRIEQLEKMESRQHTLSYMDNTGQLEKYFSEYNEPSQASSDNTPIDVPDSHRFFGNPGAQERIPNEYEAVSTQLIHGMPDSLVYLFKQVIEVSRKALKYRLNGLEFDHDLILACTHVEGLLENWKSQFEQTRPTDLLVNRVNEAVMHHALGFHASLVVYHYRLAKDVNRMLLQPYLERAIEHLEKIINLNKQGELVAVPFFFTGFICACEISAENTVLRDRYDRFFSDMRAQALSTYYTACNVVKEVQTRRAKGSPSDNWWEVIKEWNVSLILI